MPADAPQFRPNTLIRNTFRLLTHCEITYFAACSKPPARGIRAKEGTMSITDDIPVDNRAFWPQVSALLDKLGVP